MLDTDVLIVGCGIAGAIAALKLAQNPQRQVTILTRESDPSESNTRYAQGGIVSRGMKDSAELLAKDILEAGAGASNPRAVDILAKEGPGAVQEILVEMAGVQFDTDTNGKYEYGMEAAHSQRRILHVGDTTGEAIINGLVKAIKKYPNISILTNTTAVDVITFPHHSRSPLEAYKPVIAHGAYAFDHKEHTIHRYLAAATILATGGLGRIFRNTTNPPGARGDGLAMAHRAGARIINAEYIQFHPTSLAVPGVEGFLISEAVRGEGAVLLTPEGEPFMEKYSPEWKDLAPRDVVSRAIHHQMETHDFSYVLLDLASKIPADTIRERFPNIYHKCLSAGIDITRDPIPVVPAAHYFCGGLLVDEWGRTNIQNLYAVGEISCTGVHGANRLASTSLLEGLVWGNRAAAYIERVIDKMPTLDLPSGVEIPQWDETGLIAEADAALIQGDMQTIQNIMWHYVGLERNSERLSRAIRELRHLWNEIETFYRTTRLSDGLIGLRNAVEVALIVAQAAFHNRQSRGCHFREDYKTIDGERLI
jgi:L-aspartate oxidase